MAPIEHVFDRFNAEQIRNGQGQSDFKTVEAVATLISRNDTFLTLKSGKTAQLIEIMIVVNIVKIDLQLLVAFSILSLKPAGWI